MSPELLGTIVAGATALGGAVWWVIVTLSKRRRLRAEDESVEHAALIERRKRELDLEQAYVDKRIAEISQLYERRIGGLEVASRECLQRERVLLEVNAQLDARLAVVEKRVLPPGDRPHENPGNRR